MWWSNRLKSRVQRLEQSRYLAGFITLTYALVSVLWIIKSDQMLAAFAPSAQALTQLQTVKGWFFVACTSLLLYQLMQRAMRRLQQKHQLLKNIINSTNDAIFVKDAQGRYVLVNQTTAALLGEAPTDLIGKGIEEFFTPEEAQHMRASESQIWQSGRSQETEEFLTFQGEARWFSTVQSLCLDERSRPIAIVGVARDITQRKQAEAERRQTEQLRSELKLLENILDVILAGYWDWNLESNGQYFSPAWKRMFGYDEHELPNCSTTWQDLIFAEDLPAVMTGLHQHIESGGHPPFASEVRYRHKNGSTVWVMFSGCVIEWDAAGYPTRVIGCHIDITERKHAEEQLRLSSERTHLANAELARATRLKDEFLANMSHELRTPLTAILGMTDILDSRLYGTLNPKQHQYVQVIAQSGNHLLTLINDILDLAKVESGKMELEIAPTSVTALCSSSVTFVKQQAYQKKIRLESQVSDTISEIEVDELRVRQALINLLSNAVKFTPEGGQVALVVTSDPSQSVIQFSVIDTGIGLAAEHIDKLFQPFVQIDSKLNRQYTGTGLGLALVKRIVELHHGMVDVTSTLGQGSCFTMTLPTQRMEDLKPARSSAKSDRRSRSSAPDSHRMSTEPDDSSLSPLILLAEDNPANIDTFSDYFTSCGFRLLIATNGQDAIDLARAHQPDIILMDIQLPEVDGLEATRRIRADAVLANVPIIALTALAMVGDRERCLAAGATEYFAKPVSLRQLKTVIEQFCRQSP